MRSWARITSTIRKTSITAETIGLLLDLAKNCGLNEAIHDNDDRSQNKYDRKFAPCFITALRSTSKVPLVIDGMDVRPMVRRELIHMHDLLKISARVDGKGLYRKTITDIVNIGIGGQDLDTYGL